MLTALRDALAAAHGRPVRLSDLARRLGTNAEVLRAVLGHAVARGWLPDVTVDVDVGPCAEGPSAPTVSVTAGGCVGATDGPLCRRCPLAVTGAPAPVTSARAGPDPR